MLFVQSYPLAIAFCFITMLCWGSWGNTQKLAARTWRYELFYWDYVVGVLLFSLLSAFTLGSFGAEGRGFLADLAQADAGSLFSAFMGGVIFNASNILLSAAIALCGMSVAFPVGVGLALVLGVLINYFSAAKGDPTFIFIGVLLIAAAIVMNGFAYKKAQTEKRRLTTKGILISVAAGIIMAFFYRFVAASMDLNDFAAPAARQNDTLYGRIHLRRRGFRQQFPVQHRRDETSGGRRTRADRRLFQRRSQNPHGRRVGRYDLVPGRIVQHDRFGQGRGGDLLRPGTGCYTRIGTLGNTDLERIQGGSQNLPQTQPGNVPAVPHRARNADLCGRLDG